MYISHHFRAQKSRSEDFNKLLWSTVHVLTLPGPMLTNSVLDVMVPVALVLVLEVLLVSAGTSYSTGPNYSMY